MEPEKARELKGHLDKLLDAFNYGEYTLAGPKMAQLVMSVRELCKFSGLLKRLAEEPKEEEKECQVEE